MSLEPDVFIKYLYSSITYWISITYAGHTIILLKMGIYKRGDINVNSTTQWNTSATKCLVKPNMSMNMNVSLVRNMSYGWNSHRRSFRKCTRSIQYMYTWHAHCVVWVVMLLAGILYSCSFSPILKRIACYL